MVYINITNFIQIGWLEKDHSMIEKSRLENAIFSKQKLDLSNCAIKSNFKTQ